MPKNELSVIENDQPKSVLVDMSNRYGMEPAAFEATVRATCMRPDKNGRIPTREEFAAFLLVAKEYNLNPLTKEIYAYASKGGGIVPIVSVDGWVNLVNSHGQCDGFELDMEHSADGKLLISCTCRLYRKDRSHPTTITEYFSECVRDTDPWKMKHRMLRHKSLIQAARYAFGFSGIYDEDEGEKIAAIDPNRDAGPPRQVNVLPDEPKQIEATANKPEPEEARDGTPPPRRTQVSNEQELVAKLSERPNDPISSGPPRTTAPKAAAPAPKDDGPSDPGPQPHRIPGFNDKTGQSHTYESWSEKYCDLIKTSPDISTVYRWADINGKEFIDTRGEKQPGPLTKVQRLRPSAYALIIKTTENVMQKLRDEQKRADDKAAKKAATPADMDAPGDMDGEPEISLNEGPSDMNPETILKWAKDAIDTVTDANQLEAFYNDTIQPHTDGLFPPDQDQIAGYYRAAEKRLGID